MTNSFKLLIDDRAKFSWAYDKEEAADDFNAIIKENLIWKGFDISCDTERRKDGKFVLDAVVEDSTPEKVIAAIKKIFPEMVIENITKRKANSEEKQR